MFEFIVLLRALSAMIITNAHYENIYPLSIIANGGLLGDVMFFAVSGFCLYNIKMDFFHWYKKRLLRIYPTVWIITFLYTILGYYSFGDVKVFFSSFIFPTHYHFVGSIVLLYIPFYFVASVSNRNRDMQNKVLIRLFSIIALIQLFIYIFVYDKSFYHIDSVYEPMIRLLFFEAMLIGAYMRVNANKLISSFQIKYVFISALFFVIYFGSKISLMRYESLAIYQIMNQYILLLLLVNLFIMSGGLERGLKNMPICFQQCLHFLSNITLEIYLVQKAIIYWFNIGIFPVNFVIVTVLIIVSATLLNWISKKMAYLWEEKSK